MADSDKQPVLITLGVVGLIVLGYLGYRFIAGNAAEPVTQEAIEIPVETPQNEPEPAAEVVTEPAIGPVTDEAAKLEVPEEPAFVLPKLDASDQLIKDGVPTLSSYPGIAAWLESDELMRKFVVLVDNVAHGSIPRKHVSFLAPQGPFMASKISDNLYTLNEESYTRYDLFTKILSGIDTQRAVEFYVLLKPLFQEAYQELGYTNKKFDEAIFQAIGRLLETPVITEPIHLVRPVVMYKYADEKLESLSEVQKQLIRMGPDNTRIIQAKLRDVALELRNIVED